MGTAGFLRGGLTNLVNVSGEIEKLRDRQHVFGSLKTSPSLGIVTK